jgi:hypothetical protein
MSRTFLASFINHEVMLDALRVGDFARVLTTLERDRLSAYRAYRDQLAGAEKPTTKRTRAR